MKRRAQAALEYIITYGWAFLVILIVIGALAYFGVLNPSKWVPDDCDFGAQLECVDYQMTAGSNEVRLFVRNNFGKDIDIKAIEVINDDGSPVGEIYPGPPTGADPCFAASCIITAGSTKEVQIVDVTNVLFEGEKQRLIIDVTFKRNKVGSPEHTIRGSLYTTTKA